MKMIKALGFARDTVKIPIIRFVIVILIVATVCSIYFITQKAEVPSSENTIAQVHTPDIRGATGFAWFRHCENLDLSIITLFSNNIPEDTVALVTIALIFLLDAVDGYVAHRYSTTFVAQTASLCPEECLP